MRPSESSEEYQLDCARQIVSILFESTGLATIVPAACGVIVGLGNWISFTAPQPVSIEEVLALRETGGKSTFVADMFNPGQARTRTSPSLHLTNLGSGENLIGHVDAHYWARNPIGHADEFLKKKTAPPSDLLQRLRARS